MNIKSSKSGNNTHETSNSKEQPPANRNDDGCNVGLLEDERKRAIYENFLFILENKKIYLDAHISLSKLSSLLCTNTSYLSKVINIQFNCNLKTLLNKYRIDHAKELLKQDSCNIQSLPAQCGFISRSTFYAAFTKFEHITPSDYRARYQSVRLRQEIDNNIHRLLIH
ncbi:MAG: AraC family transcriptional regulator [Bacteroides sp.]|nr:AraC family transcriptional regulator [Bacteroides sp.]